MSTHAHPESTASICSQMVRAVSLFSGSLTSYTAGSALATRWMEGGSESPFIGSQVKKGCTRLEAEISQLRKRLNTEMKLLPIVQSTDAGGLACEFMFPAARGSQHKSTITAPPAVAVSYCDVEELDVSEASQRARTENPQDTSVSPEDIKEAHGLAPDVEDPRIVESPSEDIAMTTEVATTPDLLPSPLSLDDGLWHGHAGETAEDVAEDSPDEESGYRMMGPDTTDDASKADSEEHEHVKTLISSPSLVKCRTMELPGTENDVQDNGDQIGSQAVSEEEFASCIGALVTRARGTAPLRAIDLSGISTTLTTRSRASGGIARMPSTTFLLYGALTSLQLDLLGDFLLRLPGLVPRSFLIARPSGIIGIISLPQFTPSRYLDSPSQLPSRSFSSRRLRAIGYPSGSDWSPLPVTRRRRTSRQPRTTISDDLSSRTVDNLRSLLLGVLLCSLLSNFAIWVLLLLGILFKLAAVSPPGAATKAPKGVYTEEGMFYNPLPSSSAESHVLPELEDDEVVVAATEETLETEIVLGAADPRFGALVSRLDKCSCEDHDGPCMRSATSDVLMSFESEVWHDAMDVFVSPAASLGDISMASVSPSTDDILDTAAQPSASLPPSGSISDFLVDLGRAIRNHPLAGTRDVDIPTLLGTLESPLFLDPAAGARTFRDVYIPGIECSLESFCRDVLSWTDDDDTADADADAYYTEDDLALSALAEAPRNALINPALPRLW